MEGMRGWLSLGALPGERQGDWEQVREEGSGRQRPLLAG